MNSVEKVFARVAVPAPLDALFDYKIPSELVEQVKLGSLVEIPFGRQKTWGIVFELTHASEHAPEKLKSLSKVKIPIPVFDEKRLAFLSWLSKYYFFPLGEVCESALPSAVREGTDRTLKYDFDAAPAKVPNKVVERPELNHEQQQALTKILAQETGSHLLWGVTGSGKTEIYLRLIEEKLAQEKSALVLVPEIALTPQLTRRFEERFPGEVAIFHSGLKPTQLRKAWLESLSGKKRIAIGARSGLFAPLPRLGAIIVDEEHDGSYKQEERLRYNARDAAVALGGILKIPVVLGSATPSAETLNGVFLEKTPSTKLNQRAVGAAQLPEIQIVDLKKSLAQPSKVSVIGSEEFPKPEVRGDFYLSPELRDAMEATLAASHQSILFLNRRGLGSQDFCRHCGHVADCPNCDVKLTPHFKTLICHYCAYEIAAPKACKNCGSTHDPFVRVGVGTEAIEEAVRFHFPNARVSRLDRDTVPNVGAMDEIVDDFRALKSDVLIGTQMVAKGHDFPNVTLVGILLAELGLAVPDFRAFERNLQLLLQVSGRAGRSSHAGRVIVQSFQPDHPVFEVLRNFKTLDDYGEFIRGEIEKRKLLHYPPSGRLVMLRFDGLDLDQVKAAAHSVGEGLRKLGAKGPQVLGPVACPIGKIRMRHRWQVLLKAEHSQALQTAVQWIVAGWDSQKLEKKYRTRLTVDRDPVQML